MFYGFYVIIVTMTNNTKRVLKMAKIKSAFAKLTEPVVNRHFNKRMSLYCVGTAQVRSLFPDNHIVTSVYAKSTFDSESNEVIEITSMYTYNVNKSPSNRKFHEFTATEHFDNWSSAVKRCEQINRQMYETILERAVLMNLGEAVILNEV